jgi:predicted MFS family arabinose efflux permease
VVSTAGLFCLVYGFTVADTDGWGAPLTLALVVTGALLLVGFVLWERRSTHPLLPLRVVLDRNRGGSFLAGGLVGAAMLGGFLFLTYFFQGTLHYSALRTGFAFLPFSAGIITGATLSSRLLPRFGPRPLMVTGLAMGALGLLWFTRLGVHSGYLPHVLPAELVVSLGMGITFVPMSSTALVGVEPKDAGVASALVNTTQQVGGSVGTALLNTVAATAATGYVLAHGPSAGAVQAAAVHGYTAAFTWSAVLLACAALASGLLIRASRQDLAEGSEPIGVLEPEPA